MLQDQNETDEFHSQVDHLFNYSKNDLMSFVSFVKQSDVTLKFNTANYQLLAILKDILITGRTDGVNNG